MPRAPDSRFTRGAIGMLCGLLFVGAAGCTVHVDDIPCKSTANCPPGWYCPTTGGRCVPGSPEAGIARREGGAPERDGRALHVDGGATHPDSRPDQLPPADRHVPADLPPGYTTCGYGDATVICSPGMNTCCIDLYTWSCVGTCASCSATCLPIDGG